MNIRIQTGSVSMDRVGKALLFFSILPEKNEYLARLDSLQWFALAMLTVLLWIRLYEKNAVLNDFIFFQMVLFLIFIIVSLKWALSQERVLLDIRYLVKILVVLSYALYVVKKDGNADFLIRAMIISSTVNAAMILPNIVPSTSAVGRNDIMIADVLVNVNQVCPDLAFTSFLLLHDFKNSRQYLKKAVDLMMILVFAVLICILGARTSLGILAAGVFLNTLSGSRRKVIRNILAAIAAMAVFMAVILYVPALYEAVGIRIMDFISMLMGHEYASTNQSSDHLRLQLIRNGFEMFWKKPLGGYGSGNYISAGFRDYDLYYYAHNNYIELAVGLGLAGLIIFYSLHVRILLRFFKTKAVFRDDRMYLAVQILICMLLADMTSVTYHVMNMWLFLLIAYAGICLRSTVCDRHLY